MNTRLAVASLVAGLALVAALPPGYSQAPGTTPTREGAPTVGHLVGHEEDGLLDIIQNALDDWDPRALVNPYLKAIPPRDPADNVRYAVRRHDLLEFIADADAAVQLGKAFFWEMQAGSDFRKLDDGTFVGTACASCHYRFGADHRDRHTARVPYVGWDQYKLDPKHDAGQAAGRFDPQQGQFKQLPPLNNVTVPPLGPPQDPDPDKFDGQPRWVPNPQDDPRNLSLIIGSQGVERRVLKEVKDRTYTVPGTDKTISWKQEIGEAPKGSGPNPTGSRLEWEMFRVQPSGRDLRQITSRNSPTVINATFADRLFHDGRAESTFNGFSIFGDDDGREVIHKRTTDQPARLIPVRVAVSHAALASQAVGPIVNEVEMSYFGRTFPDLADKLLPARVLFAQTIDPNDSVFKGTDVVRVVDGVRGTTYEKLIKKAFRTEWWDEAGVQNPQVDLELKLGEKKTDADGGYHRDPVKGTIMQANFPLYWGLSLMLYQSTLVSNNTPFDQMMRGNPQGIWNAWERNKGRVGNVKLDRLRVTAPGKPGIPPAADDVDEDSRLRAKRLEKGQEATPPNNPKIIATAVFQRGLRVFQNADCRDCHDGPNFSELFDRTANHRIELPIGRQLAHTLFPNAQGDAAAITLAGVRRRLVADLATLVKGKQPALSAERAERVAQELVRKLAAVEGEFWRLPTVLKPVLVGFGFPDDSTLDTLIADVGGRLRDFELSSRNGLGRRPFFPESQRVPLAEQITGAVRIERMVIPENQVFARPKMPSGGLPNDPYAFYDGGFYTLGLTHPRFDFGIGGIPHIDEDDNDPLVAAEKAGGTTRQPAQGAAGSAYRFKADRKGLGGVTKDKRKPAAYPTAQQKANAAAPAAAPATPHPDISWSRTQLPPEVHWTQMPEPRRSQIHFLSHARDRVSDEESWGHRNPFLHDNELMFWGSFKTPALRNVELTGPYMHNGQLQSLEQVIEFYDRGGLIDRSEKYNPDKHPRIRPMNLMTDDKKALLFFLLCLTDEAVRAEKGPFDHPSLRVPNGYDADWKQRWVSVSAHGRTGRSSTTP